MTKTPIKDALIAEGLLSATPRRDRVRETIAAALHGERPPAVIAIKGQLTEAYGAAIRKQIAEAWQAPRIVLYINSPGGRAIVGDAIAEDLSNIGRKVEAHGLDHVASAAIRIFAAAKTRKARPSTIFTIHRSSLHRDAIGERVNGNQLKMVAARMLEGDKKELQWFERNGIALTSRHLDQFLAGEDVRLKGHAALSTGLVHGFDPEPSQDERRSQREQDWTRYVRERTAAADDTPRIEAQSEAAKGEARDRWTLLRDRVVAAGMEHLIQDRRARMQIGIGPANFRPAHQHRPVIF
jgi:ATP-dependent protease ClpP protease subunit